MSRNWWTKIALLLVLAASAGGCLCRDRPGLFARFRGQAPMPAYQPNAEPFGGPCPCPCDSAIMNAPFPGGGSPLLLTPPPGVSEGVPGPNGMPAPLPSPPPGDQAKPGAAPPSTPMKSVRVAQPISWPKGY